jgi:hypothetical protein
MASPSLSHIPTSHPLFPTFSHPEERDHHGQRAKHENSFHRAPSTLHTPHSTHHAHTRLTVDIVHLRGTGVPASDSVGPSGNGREVAMRGLGEDTAEFVPDLGVQVDLSDSGNNLVAWG